MLSFSNEELASGKKLSIGDVVVCPNCHREHRVCGARNMAGDITDALLFVYCGAKTFLVGVCGRNIINKLRSRKCN